MGTSLATSASSQEIMQGTPYRSSFFVVGGMTAGTELYQCTRAISDLQAPNLEIGYPELRLHGIGEDVGYASISTGISEDGTAGIWQINATGHNNRFIVHGQLTNGGESWELISIDHQGRLLQEAAIEDGSPTGTGRLAAFVLNAAKQVPLIAIAERLAAEKEITAIQSEHYRTESAQTDKLAFGNKMLAQVHGQYVDTGFKGFSANTLQHMLRFNTHRPDRTITVEQLPQIVNKILACTDYKVEVPASKPKRLDSSAMFR